MFAAVCRGVTCRRVRRFASLMPFVLRFSGGRCLPLRSGSGAVWGVIQFWCADQCARGSGGCCLSDRRLDGAGLMYSCDTAGGAASPGRDRNLRMTGHGIKTGYSGRFGRTVAQVLSRHARGFFGCVLRKRSASWNGLWIFWRSVAGGDDLRFNREVCWGFLRGLQSCGGGRLECGRRADIGSLARLL